MRILKPISVNPTKEKALFEFLETHGTKKAVVKLFDFYQNNQDIMQNILDKLNNINVTKIQSKKLNDFVIDDEADEMLNSFIKWLVHASPFLYPNVTAWFCILITCPIKYTLNI